MLLLFDIDGTLTDTYEVDGKCYIEALNEAFEIQNASSDWTVYPDTTDSAILNSIFETQFHRLPTQQEVDRMIGCFHSRLTFEFEVTPTSCKPIPGGPNFIRSLEQNGIPFAIATGGWRDTAALKLQTAGYPLTDKPMATASETTRRIDICRMAVRFAESHYSRQFSKVVYIGDGIWDAKAAEELNYEFVGRTENTSKFDGHRHQLTIPNFSDVGIQQRIIALENPTS